MKKILIFVMCIVILLSFTSCRKNNIKDVSSISSELLLNITSTITPSQPEIPVIDNSSVEVSSVQDTVSDNNSSQTSSTDSSITYDDIVCTKINYFQKVSFYVKDTDTILFLTMPDNWRLEKSGNGYNILKDSKTIGSVTTTTTFAVNEATNVFFNQLTTNNIKVSHSIDDVTVGNEPSYNRTLCYNYTDENRNSKNIVFKFPYQEIDGTAAYKMITEVKKEIAATRNSFGILQIQDNRNKILVLGNSFINSSRIGPTLQAMCGNDVLVEAHSRGYAHVGTYTNDADTMQRIQSGNYSAVFICGLYDQEAVSDLSAMIDVCNVSNTKLAIFPAHNENQDKIDHAVSLYPNTIILDWKAEINDLIYTGIDVSHFCIPDAHNHSTPLAGYVGAHMIYRAIFNKVPQTTQFNDVTQSEINLLGDYSSTGAITLLDKSSAYEINDII